jgi:hypothetical protein
MDGAFVAVGQSIRTIKHVLQPHTRCMSAGARAEWACEHMPAAPSSRAKPQHPRMLPSAVYMRTQKAEGIKYVGDTRCAPGDIHMTASAMARTYIVVTELVSHPEMLPLNEDAPSLANMACSNTHGA